MGSSWFHKIRGRRRRSQQATGMHRMGTRKMRSLSGSSWRPLWECSHALCFSDAAIAQSSHALVADSRPRMASLPSFAGPACSEKDICRYTRWTSSSCYPFTSLPCLPNATPYALMHFLHLLIFTCVISFFSFRISSLISCSNTHISLILD